MLYRNTKTGAVIDVASELSGDWEAVKQSPNTSFVSDHTDTAAPAKKRGGTRNGRRESKN